MHPIEITIRPYESPKDDAYIYSTWTRYAWFSPKEPIKTPKQKWFKEKAEEIKAILSPETVKVACFKDNPYVIAGYIVVHHSEITWICVKKDYRRQGIERLLMQSMKERLHGQEE